jgi:hypothetical protein
MKKCTICNQTYTDESLNFCLSDGGTLVNVSDDAPPTVFMNQARTTNQSNWGNESPFTPPSYEPMSPWQNPAGAPVPSYMSSANPYSSPNQTLPVISLVLGIVSVVFCCYGFPMGVGALITGFIGYNNTKQNPSAYGGQGMAIAGMILGGVSLAILLLFVLFGIAGGR